MSITTAGEGIFVGPEAEPELEPKVVAEFFLGQGRIMHLGLEFVTCDERDDIARAAAVIVNGGAPRRLSTTYEELEDKSDLVAEELVRALGKGVSQTANLDCQN